MSKNLSAKNYQEKKEKNTKEAREGHKSLCKEEKEKNPVHGPEWNSLNENLSKEEKNKLAQYRKCIVKWEKTPY